MVYYSKIFLNIASHSLEMPLESKYNIGRIIDKGAVKMAAVTVKPIQPTVITDKKIIMDVIREVTTEPSSVAVTLNKEAMELLCRLQGKK